MTVALIQARMKSTRLPGKVMLPLRGKPSICRTVQRVAAAESVNTICVASPETPQSDIIEATLDGMPHVDVYRGPEHDVLGRLSGAATRYPDDRLLRLTGDCPLLPPEVIDAVVGALKSERVDYASNVVNRTFPRGFDVEAFTASSFEDVADGSTSTAESEHVTLQYRDDTSPFETAHIESEDVYDAAELQNRDELRLTLDEPADYEVIRSVCDSLGRDGGIPDGREIIREVDRTGVGKINHSIEQKHVTETERRDDDEVVGYVDTFPITESERYLLED